MRRASTKKAHTELVRDLGNVLDLEPFANLEHVVSRLPCSRSTLQRALSANGTCFTRERRARLLDRAALRLIDDSSPSQAYALREAGRAAGTTPNHLCEGFRLRFGLSPGRVWRAGVAIRQLRGIARSPWLHSREQPAAYRARRRRILRLRSQLIRTRTGVVDGTLVAKAIDDALALNLSKPRAHRRRARARSRARRRRNEVV